MTLATRLTLLTWMVGAAVALRRFNLGASLQILARLPR